ncbi:MAG: metal-dependent hydrolase [archaeon]
MMLKSHLMFGLLIGLFGVQFLHPIQPFLFVLIVTATSTLPDIDTTRSFIGRKLPFYATILNFFFGHRGILHTVYPAVFLFILAGVLGYPLVGFAILVGYAAHLILDALTLDGIKIFKPFHDLHIMGIIRTGGMFELVIFYFFFALVSYKIYYLLF